MEKLLVFFGNSKLPVTTMIFNLESAKNCSGKAKNLCKCSEKCYAMKAERIYPKVFPYRERQSAYFLNNSAETICEYFSAIILRKRIKPTLFRFNESGEFANQESVEKLDKIAKYLKKHHKITTYGYSSRSDLDFSGVSFLVKGSGHSNGNNGETMVIKKSENVPENFKLCPGSCKKCKICSSKKKINVAFRQH